MYKRIVRCLSLHWRSYHLRADSLLLVQRFMPKLYTRVNMTNIKHLCCLVYHQTFIFYSSATFRNSQHSECTCLFESQHCHGCTSLNQNESSLASELTQNHFLLERIRSWYAGQTVGLCNLEWSPLVREFDVLELFEAQQQSWIEMACSNVLAKTGFCYDLLDMDTEENSSARRDEWNTPWATHKL